MNPRISVIVPVYNVEKYLCRCIDCILAQTFTDFELLLIDDGSKDKSGEICDEYAAQDSRIRVFHKQNGGASSARNVGLNHAIGEYICFCDADDWVEQTWLLSFSERMDDNDMLISSFNVYENEKKVESKTFDSSNDKKRIIKELEHENVSGYLWCKCFRKSIIDRYNVRFNEAYTIWEDMDFIYRYWCYSYKIMLIGNVCTYNYNMPNFQEKYGSISSFNCCFDLMKSIYIIFKEKNFIYKKYFNIAKYCIKQSFKEGSLNATLRNSCRFFVFDLFR